MFELLNPGLLGWLALAAAPLILHLLARPPRETIALPTFRFLAASAARRRSRFQWQDWLLAMLRCLVIAGVVLAMLRPTWTPTSAAPAVETSGDVAIVIDVSASMTTQSRPASAALISRVHEAATYLADAKAAARTIVAGLPAATRVRLVRLSTRAEVVFDQVIPERSQLASAIDRLEPSATRANLAKAWSLWIGSQAGATTPSHVYVITDRQANSWEELRSLAAAPAEVRRFTTTVIDVGGAAPLGNLSVSNGDLLRPAATIGLPVRLVPRVTNHGERAASVVLRVLVDDVEIWREPLEIAAGQSIDRTTSYHAATRALHTAVFEIDADAYAADDRYAVPLVVESPIRVLLVDGDERDGDSEGAAYYLAAALAGERGKPAPTEAPVEKDSPDHAAAPFIVRPIALDALSPAALAAADVCILVDFERLSPAVLADVQAFVAAGGGLWILPGERLERATWQRSIAAAAARYGEPLVGVTMSPLATVDPESDRELALAPRDFAHPFFRDFDVGRGDWNGVRLDRYFPLELPATAPNATGAASANAAARLETLAVTGDDRPVLVLSSFRRGRVLVSGFALTPRWTNLVVRPECVPFVTACVRAIRPPGPLIVPPRVIAESPAMIVWRSPDRIAHARITPPGELAMPLDFTAPHTTTALGEEVNARFEAPRRAGVATIDVTTAAPHERTVTAAIAIETDPVESDPARISHEAIREMLHDPHALVLSMADLAAARELRTVSPAWELSFVGVIIAAIALAIEFLLATRVFNAYPSAVAG